MNAAFLRSVLVSLTLVSLSGTNAVASTHDDSADITRDALRFGQRNRFVNDSWVSSDRDAAIKDTVKELENPGDLLNSNNGDNILNLSALAKVDPSYPEYKEIIEAWNKDEKHQPKANVLSREDFEKLKKSGDWKIYREIALMKGLDAVRAYWKDKETSKTFEELKHLLKYDLDPKMRLTDEELATLTKEWHLERSFKNPAQLAAYKKKQEQKRLAEEAQLAKNKPQPKNAPEKPKPADEVALSPSTKPGKRAEEAQNRNRELVGPPRPVVAHKENDPAKQTPPISQPAAPPAKPVQPRATTSQPAPPVVARPELPADPIKQKPVAPHTAEISPAPKPNNPPPRVAQKEKGSNTEPQPVPVTPRRSPSMPPLPSKTLPEAVPPAHAAVAPSVVPPPQPKLVNICTCTVEQGDVYYNQYNQLVANPPVCRVRNGNTIYYQINSYRTVNVYGQEVASEGQNCYSNCMGYFGTSDGWNSCVRQQN